MKAPHKLIALGLAIFLMVIASVPVAMALPPLPSSFYGTVKVNGANVSLRHGCLGLDQRREIRPDNGFRVLGRHSV